MRPVSRWIIFQAAEVSREGSRREFLYRTLFIEAFSHVLASFTAGAISSLEFGGDVRSVSQRFSAGETR